MSVTTTKTTATHQADWLERLRVLTPPRGLSSHEARYLAEHQATGLLHELQVQGPALPNALLAELPLLSVGQQASFKVSGLSTRTASGWVILLQRDEPKVRQRFSLAHELKHVIDDPFVGQLYPSLGHDSAHQRAERICDYFAGCLLMPKRWLLRDWCSGRQNVERLAARYQVSRAAMRVRLSQLGLSEPTPRCRGSEVEAWT